MKAKRTDRLTPPTHAEDLVSDLEVVRAEAAATTAQLQAMQALTDTALSHLDLDGLLRELLGRVLAVMGVGNVGIFLLDEDGRTLTLRAGRGLGEEHVGRVQVPVGWGISGRIAASRAPLIVDDLSAFLSAFVGRQPILRETARSAVGVPLLVEEHAVDRGEGKLDSREGAGRLVGVLAMGSATPRHFTAADVQLLQRVADRIALAIDRARLYAAEQDARHQAEAALARAQASETQATGRAARLTTILETLAEGVVVYDADAHPIQMNRAYRELYAVTHAPAGYAALPARERLQLLAMRDATTGAPLAFEGTPTARALRGETGTGLSAEYRARAFDGRELEVHSSVAALREPDDGRIVGAVLVLRDVTEHNRLAREREAAREQAECQADQLDRIFEAAADGLIVWDVEGRIVRANPAARRILSLDATPPDFDQLPVRERLARYAIRDEQDRLLLPEEWPFMRMLRGEVGTGTGTESRAEARDVRVRALDGREIELTYSTAPLRDREGHLVAAVTVLHDQTERNRLAREREAAREQAERQADQLDRIFEAAADGLIVYDATGRLMRANAAARRILGLDAAPLDYYQLPVSERLALYAARDEQDRPLPLEEWPVMRALRAQGGTGTGPATRDLRTRALDGREMEVTVSTAPLWDREGRLVGAVNVFRDLTERNRLTREREAARTDELAAREASRRLEAFLATAAHDLRTPLTSTIGYLALAQRRTERLAGVARQERPDFAQQLEAVCDRLEEADQSAARLARLLTLLFDTAAVRADKLELHRAPCDLAALVREQVAALRVAAPDRTIMFRVLHAPDIDEPIPVIPVIPVEVDADRIGQVVTNYVTNALKYAPPDQPVEVSVAVRGDVAHGGRARVAVRDAGPGIPKAERTRVWELFHRAPGVAAQGRMPDAASRQSGSLGLGLHISKAIIQAHGGRVGVASAVGKGSTFWFTLPLTDATADATTP